MALKFLRLSKSIRACSKTLRGGARRTGHRRVCEALEERRLLAAGDIVWTREFGSVATDDTADVANAISADSSGAYVAGRVEGTLPGQTNLGSFDAFVRKYDSDGTELWTRQFGSSAFDEALGISVGDSGVYVAGRTNGTLPGQTSAGSADLFVRKYDADGNELWTRQFGTAGFDAAGVRSGGNQNISVSDSGVYVSGFTTGTFQGQTSAGSADLFVRKYDADGNELWTRQFGTTGNDQEQGISVSGSGVYVAASAFDDAFVYKYDTDGNEVWTRQFGTPDTDNAEGTISADSSGVYVAGLTRGTFPSQTNAGGLDAFLRKYDAAGNEVWTRQFGTSGTDRAQGISVADSGVYVVGHVGGALPGQTSAGGGARSVCPQIRY